MNNHPVLILFAKKPAAGQVKTRLSPPLSADQATDVAMVLIRQSLDNACKYWPGVVELSLWPDTDDDFIQSLAEQYQCLLSIQSKGNLGDKMYTALANKIALNQAALILGCDVPHCSGEILQMAFTGLLKKKNIIGPTVDGGYYCIGTHVADRRMFKDVNWGTDQALAQTISSCKNAGIEFDLRLPKLRDLDCYDDLVVISEQCPVLKSFLI